jgi:predicted 3-demethylubiquinone-9 3-methyltransferase (glyoxalase superfamily)
MTAHGLATCLWFDTQAEEAENFYVSIFENYRVDGISRNGLVTAAASTGR